MEKSEAWYAGYRCGFTEPNTDNCHFKYFATGQMMQEWHKGKTEGAQDRLKKIEDNYRNAAICKTLKKEK